MYPVDLLKVGTSCCSPGAREPCVDTRTDADAGCQPRAWRHVQRHIQCHGHNLEGRGRAIAMAGIVQRRNGCRCVAESSLSLCGQALTVQQAPRTPSTSHPTRPQSTRWAETRAATKNTTRSRQRPVVRRQLFRAMRS
jgi:hypothetical protein